MGFIHNYMNYSTFAVRFAVQLADGRPRTEDQRIPNLFKMHELARIDWFHGFIWAYKSQIKNLLSPVFRLSSFVFRPTQHLILSTESLKCESWVN